MGFRFLLGKLPSFEMDFLTGGSPFGNLQDSAGGAKFAKAAGYSWVVLEDVTDFTMGMFQPTKGWFEQLEAP